MAENGELSKCQPLNDPRAYCLFARPSFVGGLARIFDFAGTLNEHNSSLTPQQADYLALHSGWLVVGDDIRSALTQLAADQAGRR